jgi:hypothetical protein
MNAYFSDSFKFVTDILLSNLKYKFDEIRDSVKLMDDLVKYYETNRSQLPPGYTPETASMEAVKELMESVKRN